MKKFYWILLIGVLVIVADQFSKYWVNAALTYGFSKPITSWFSLTYIFNTGTAFGLFAGNNKALVIVALTILSFLLYSARGLCERTGAWGLWGIGLVFGGAIGNLIDRIRIGRVIDFLDFHFWPVFNLADTAISIGAACLIIGVWFDQSPESRI